MVGGERPAREIIYLYKTGVLCRLGTREDQGTPLPILGYFFVCGLDDVRTMFLLALNSEEEGGSGGVDDLKA